MPVLDRPKTNCWSSKPTSILVQGRQSHGAGTDGSIFRSAFPLVDDGAPRGNRTPNPLIKRFKVTRAEQRYLGIAG
jgi:hypothetical protein